MLFVWLDWSPKMVKYVGRQNNISASNGMQNGTKLKRQSPPHLSEVS